MEELNIENMIVAINALASEKDLPEEAVVEAVEAAIAAAWRKDHGNRDMDVRAVLNRQTGTAKIILSYEVVEAPELIGQVTLDQAREIKADAKLGDKFTEEFEAEKFGRIATQIAKQVLTQKLREFEKVSLARHFAGSVGKLINGTIARTEPRVIKVELGQGEGILPYSEQVQGERYAVGSRIRVLLKKIDDDGKRGPTLILSRADAEFVRQLFIGEVPETDTGAVEIVSIAREAGRRTKIAVSSSSSEIDPVGTFVGSRGVRVQAVMSELPDTEKIDIVMFDKDIHNFIANALSPAEIDSIEVDARAKRATVYVAESQQPAAIGRQGQNVRLASELTGYEINIVADASLNDTNSD